MTKYVEQAVNAIIRPPRREYDPADIPVFLEGPGQRTYVRHPVNVVNERDQRLVGSLYVDATIDLMSGIPCLMYLHGNSSSQLEGQFLIPNICPHGIALYCFDFAGCGASEGGFVSLGHYETIDAVFLITHLNAMFGLGPFVLWGRSMGGATALMVQHELLRGRIVDSAYTSVPGLVASIARSLNIPAIFNPGAVWLLKRMISGRADFDISNVSALKMAEVAGNVPLVICHAQDDEFIPIAHGEELFKAYRSEDKKFVRVYGGHNGRRTLDFFTEACSLAIGWFGKTVPNGYRAVRLTGICDGDNHFRSYDDLLMFSAGQRMRTETDDSPLGSPNLREDEDRDSSGTADATST
jgi:pimeloyl-ACP methyl ester carboxylesterase